jgi:hypothetical protein
LDVLAFTTRGEDFSKEDGPPVSKLRHKVPKLMSRIGKRDGGSSLRDLIAGEERVCNWSKALVRNAQFFTEGTVQGQ